ncbi:unnamed protein product [Candidula unifasciata]|uniref:Ubiquitin-like domain-containing protein n=1 Tax=Candidula unifasciata TaxID=100452 RepID=A0A8S3ZJX3_9EUPU|nr:unnamed protein product [Candidula unifasciata]
MELSGDTPVTLVIKAPNQRMADQTVECMTGWTIQKLKQHLEMVYPTKPKHNEQRLIYSGRLLQDKQTLKEILRQYDDSLSSRHTIHLVCSSLMDSSPASSASSSVNANSAQSPVAKPVASVSSGTCSSETASTSQSDGVRFRGHHQLPQPSSSHDPANAHLAYTAYQPGVVQGDAASYTPEQYHWMMQQQQQMYSQYMMQYMMYYQCMYNPGLSVAPMMPPSFSQHIVANTHPQQQVPHAPDAAAAAVNNGAQEAARPNVRMNAQGGVEEEEDDEGEPRDWLHHMYFFMRVLTFLGILFFYSNLSRFLIVFTGSFCIYALQKLRKYWQQLQQQERQERQQQQQAPQQEQQQQEQNEQPQQQPDTPADVRNEEVPENVPPPGPQAATDQQPAVEEDGSRLARIMTFVGNTVQAFFTSLLPTATRIA